MDYLKQFILPIEGLKNGFHSYNFRLDSQFFNHFELSPINNGVISVTVDLNKEDHIYSFCFNITGFVNVDCDRCLASIELPIFGEYNVVVKQKDEVSDDPDLIFISPEVHEYNIADLLYEFACVSLPISNLIDCDNMDNPPCNFELLKYYQNTVNNKEDNSTWDILKNLKTN